jgi:hypothetical protein
MEAVSLFESIPQDIWKSVFVYTDSSDLFNFFIICKGVTSYFKDLEIWKFWIKQEFSTYYDVYLKDIDEKNQKSQEALETINKLNVFSVNITRAYVKFIYEYNTEQFNESIETLTRRYNDDILKDPLVDIIETDPITLYKQFYTKSKVVPCEYYIIVQTFRSGGLCGKPSMPKQKYCKTCFSKITLTEKLKVFFSNLPLCGARTVLEPLTSYLPPQPKKFSVKSIGDGKYITTNEPYFVLINSDCKWQILGVKDGENTRDLTEDEKKIAREYGFVC